MTLHDRALKLAKVHRKIEGKLILVIAEIDRTATYKHHDCPSLFVYVTKILGYDPTAAYPLITVSRKAAQIPELQQAVVTDQLTIPAASRLASALTKENAEHLVSFATQNSARETEKEIRRVRPDLKRGKKIEISTETNEKLKRLQSVLAQKHQRHLTPDEAIAQAIDLALYKLDPIEKAKRAKPQQTTQPKTKPGRQPLTAAQKHAVNQRDQGVCTHPGCDQDRWIEFHHVIEVQNEGTNDPENLTTLCSFHHKQQHSRQIH